LDWVILLKLGMLLPRHYKVKAIEFLESTGLTSQREDRPFDGFKGRVIPYTKYVWKSTGFFGGRILTNDKKAAKYLNSPEAIVS
jgi:DNA primase